MRAHFTYADSMNVSTTAVAQWVPTGIRGDGRLRDGSPGSGIISNEYQGQFCGVAAVIGNGTGDESTDFNYTPDGNWSDTMPGSCKPARFYRYYLDGPDLPPAIASPHNIVVQVWELAVGETRLVSFMSGTQSELGFGLWFDDAYPPASSLQVTRVPDVVDVAGRTVRRWRVATRGTHRAMKTDRQIPTGVSYYLPFSLTLTAVPYPYPTYP